jgi:hypothetical protein
MKGKQGRRDRTEEERHEHFHAARLKRWGVSKKPQGLEMHV